jgi:NADPH:quinone reductase-like Zn-dependent oxidoreductase
MINDGKIRTIIDRVYSMKEVRQAHEYYGKWTGKGKFVIDMERG